tara:strand:+ start:1709 stop:2338 length:630 start_codon:yes stop_codon:yes gene_type:complete
MGIVAFRSSILDWNHVSTGSMNPAIIEGDRVIVEKSAYDFELPLTDWKAIKTGNPSRGEIVIFREQNSSHLLIKRIVGLPGETIEVLDNKVLVNKVQAHYQPLQKGFFNHLDLYSRTKNHFALEIFEDAEHPIMLQKKPNQTSNSPKQVDIPAGYYYVLGDNRNSSIDSRNIGLIPREQIAGRARKIAFSLDYSNFYVPRKDRFFKDLN